MPRIQLTEKNRSKSVDWKGIVVDSLYIRDGGICQLCKKSLSNDDFFEIDHITQRSEGGKDTLMNLRLVHLSCHKLRHANRKTLLPDIKFESDVPTMNISVKKAVHLAFLNNLKKALAKKRQLTKACSIIGVTPDQAKYYLSVYRLDWREFESWDLSNI
jgi:hypothetical protein